MSSIKTNQTEAYLTLCEFAKEMVAKLEECKSKYGDFTLWEGPENFSDHLLKETNELLEAIMLQDKEEINKEAIDVANMAFMVWWHSRRIF